MPGLEVPPGCAGSGTAWRATAWSILIASTLGVCTLPRTVGAQRTGRDSTDAYFEIHWNAGLFAPVGSQRPALKKAPYYQVLAVVAPIRELGLVASAGWTGTRERGIIENAPVEILEVEGGLELRPYAIRRGASLIRPSFGIGLGARSYSYSVNSATVTSLAGYVSIGLAYEYAATGVRISIADHFSAYTGVDGHAPSSTRHEAILMLGVIARAVP